MTIKNFSILDCTLRDGGYYTNWDFDLDLVRSLVKTLDQNNVDIIELGYKSPVKGGLYRKCNDGFIKQVVDFSIDAKLAFMIDAKDFIVSDRVDFNLLEDCIKEKHKSPFDICRLAIKENEINISKQIAEFILQKGYQLYVNLMSVSLLHSVSIIKFLKDMNQYGHTLYVADSYGSLTPDQITNIANICMKHNSGHNGIHCHDNLGLAFANSLQAINHGFDHVDCTILGMGRGVGNTKTEQVILHRNGDITPEMLDLIEKFKKLQNIYQWGFNAIYMIGGMKHIHPLYLQDINLSNLNSDQKVQTTKELNGQINYNKNLLEEYKQQKSVVVIPARYKSSRFPGKPLAKILGKEMILHVADKAAQAVGSENVYIATENDEISKIVKKAGYKVVLTSDNCLTGTDRIAEASLEIDADIYINVQGDEPMINPEDINRTIALKKQNPDCVINCMSKLNYDEDPKDTKIPKVVCGLNNILLYSSRSAIPGRKDGISKNVMKQVCIYAFNKQELNTFHSSAKTPLEQEEDIEILRFIEKGIKVKMMEVDSISYAVDYPDDISVVEKKLMSIGHVQSNQL